MQDPGAAATQGGESGSPEDGSEDLPTPRENVPEALKQWRDAERAAAVARRGRAASEAAAEAAKAAESAARATAEAARRALEAATLAEASASQTAEAAKRSVVSAQLEAEEARTDSALADAGEGLAHHYYRDAVDDAGKRLEGEPA
jgi:hypothetical protein